MRRLSIIDLSTGHQPVFNEDKSVAVVFNGEIYNHIELKEELVRQGHRFTTDHSDTEVIVHLYEEHGPDYLHKLNGMFAIALWDIKKGELHLARDRAGIKPLFVSPSFGRLIFGSEIKAILAHPDVTKEPDLVALGHYFSFKNTPAPRTAFAGIEQLRPGERAVFKNGQLTRKRWWRLDMSQSVEMTEVEAAAHLRELLEDSVRLRMRSDVPFGAYLSGGLDSSSVVALMSQISGKRVTTFSMVYDDDYMLKGDDRKFALEVSKMYDTDHHEYLMTHSDLVDSVEPVLDAFDEPFSGVTSTYFITRLISQHVKVALSGDGADELFGSYLPHRLANPLARYDAMMAAGDGVTDKNRAELGHFADQLEFFEKIANRGGEVKRRMGQYLFDDGAKASLFSDGMQEAITNSTEALIKRLYEEARTSDPLNRALFVDFETLLPDQVLAFVDRLSMAHSVEVRPPFLDYRIIEFAGFLPGEMKIKGLRCKNILKEAVRGLIPDAIIDRPKEGFVLPINDWLLEDLKDYTQEMLSAEHISRHGLLNVEFVSNILQGYYNGRAQNGSRIWNLLMFQAWWERNFV